eukprot:5706034-Amphidinium_carterae.1
MEFRPCGNVRELFTLSVPIFRTKSFSVAVAKKKLKSSLTQTSGAIHRGTKQRHIWSASPLKPCLPRSHNRG